MATAGLADGGGAGAACRRAGWPPRAVRTKGPHAQSLPRFGAAAWRPAATGQDGPTGPPASCQARPGARRRRPARPPPGSVLPESRGSSYSCGDNLRFHGGTRGRPLAGAMWSGSCCTSKAPIPDKVQIMPRAWGSSPRKQGFPWALATICASTAALPGGWRRYRLSDSKRGAPHAMAAAKAAESAAVYPELYPATTAASVRALHQATQRRPMWQPTSTMSSPFPATNTPHFRNRGGRRELESPVAAGGPAGRRSRPARTALRVVHRGV